MATDPAPSVQADMREILGPVDCALCEQPVPIGSTALGMRVSTTNRLLVWHSRCALYLSNSLRLTLDDAGINSFSTDSHTVRPADIEAGHGLDIHEVLPQ